MAKKADADKAAAQQLSEAMGGIEAAAAAAFARDQAAAAEATHAEAVATALSAGVWEWDAGSGYYYNEAKRWYYDPKTKWYYGGEPVAWAQDPPKDSLPAASRFGVAAHTGGPEPPYKRPSSSAAAAGGSGSGSGAPVVPARLAAGVASGAVVVKTVKKVVALPQHPQALIGGHQMHHVEGKIGGAKGVGSGDDAGKVGRRPPGWAAREMGWGQWLRAGRGVRPGARSAPHVALPRLLRSRLNPCLTPMRSLTLNPQRKREQGAAAAGGKGGKPVDPAEAAALARREAARQRVQQRTQASFGLS
jgi:WW domain-binding protein 4